jgi:predicted CXXCH cytochrome family protein
MTVVAALLAVFPATAFSQALMTGTAHDLAGSTTYGLPALDQVCTPCHAPHNNLNAAGDLLWNHTATASTFTMYSNTATIDGAIDAQPTANSKICLSCHDGTVAINAYNGAVGTTNSQVIQGSANVGIDLSDDHPISILYQTASGTLFDSGLKARTGQQLPLFNDEVECGSCHNPHEPTIGKFLRIANTASALCVDCHTKGGVGDAPPCCCI